MDEKKILNSPEAEAAGLTKTERSLVRNAFGPTLGPKAKKDGDRRLGEIDAEMVPLIEDLETTFVEIGRLLYEAHAITTGGDRGRFAEFLKWCASRPWFQSGGLSRTRAIELLRNERVLVRSAGVPRETVAKMRYCRARDLGSLLDHENGPRGGEKAKWIDLASSDITVAEFQEKVASEFPEVRKPRRLVILDEDLIAFRRYASPLWALQEAARRLALVLPESMVEDPVIADQWAAVLAALRTVGDAEIAELDERLEAEEQAEKARRRIA